jgi:uncharacterized membrane protein
LTFSGVVKNLGVLFDESLSGRYQVHVIRQVYLRLRQLYHFSRLLSSSIKIKLVKSLISPNLKCLGVNIKRLNNFFFFFFFQKNSFFNVELYYIHHTC